MIYDAGEAGCKVLRPCGVPLSSAGLGRRAACSSRACSTGGRNSSSALHPLLLYRLGTAPHWRYVPPSLLGARQCPPACVALPSCAQVLISWPLMELRVIA